MTEVPSVWYNRKRGIWIIAGYDDVRKALRDNEELSSAQSQSRFRVYLPSMNAADPPSTLGCANSSPALLPHGR